jgi:hypothetical protein
MRLLLDADPDSIPGSFSDVMATSSRDMLSSSAEATRSSGDVVLMVLSFSRC